MNAIQLIKHAGIKKAKEVVDVAANGTTHIHSITLQNYKYGDQKNYVWGGSDRKDWHISIYEILEGMIVFDELKRLVESVDLVNECGGISSCRKKLSTRDKCEPNATHFAIHPDKPHLIQMYRINEPKLEPNYSFSELEKAIAVHESIYREGNE